MPFLTLLAEFREEVRKRALEIKGHFMALYIMCDGV